MKVLIVKKKDSCFPFVEEQTNALKSIGVEFDFFLIEGKGLKCYLSHIWPLKKTIKKNKYDIVHAHYGLSGLLANTQRIVPVVTTYHGSDVNSKSIRIFSRLCARLSAFNIFVSPHLQAKIDSKNSVVIPCGININDFPETDKSTARKIMKIAEDEKIVLFSSDFHTPIKNPQLAKDAVARLDGVRLIELFNYTRSEVNLLMHAADVCLMTSFNEGSPQFIKEAMTCGSPIVTTRVGDTKEVIGKTEGCFFTGYEVEECTETLKKALLYAQENNRTNGRSRIIELGLNNDSIAEKVKAVYDKVNNNK